MSPTFLISTRVLQGGIDDALKAGCDSWVLEKYRIVFYCNGLQITEIPIVIPKISHFENNIEGSFGSEWHKVSAMLKQLDEQPLSVVLSGDNERRSYLQIQFQI